MDLARLDYFATSLKKRIAGQGGVCPNCGDRKFAVADRKHVVTELRRCESCRLLYRAPTDTEEDNRRFYQRAYTSGFTTDLPDDEALEKLKASRFTGAQHDYGYYISVIEALGVAPGRRVFDFGCSWGYGSWQIAAAGYDVVSFEISEPRARFAREKLGVDVLDRLPQSDAVGDLGGTFDCFFSSHVMEHVPQPANAIALAAGLLKPGGWFVAFTPNGSAAFRAAEPESWHRLWGKVHPNLIDDQFWRAALDGRPMLLGSSPVEREDVAAFRGTVGVTELDLSGGELVCLARF